jgi:peptidoglycan/LPS O-acetylase OafA/YrhL
MGLKYEPSLDGIRALACLAVIFLHTGVPGFSGGALGVDVFFVLSGYLITSLLAEEWRQSGRINQVAFWRRRARRLYPALLVMLVVTAPLYTLLNLRQSLRPLAEAVLGALYLSDFANARGFYVYLRHLWSLAIEAQFYALWPLVVPVLLRRIGAKRGGVLLYAAWALLSVARAFRTSTDADWNAVYHAIHWHSTGLVLGAALALLPPRLPRGAGWTGLALLSFLALGAFSHPTDYLQLGIALNEIGAALLLMGLTTDAGLRSALSWRPLVQLGLISYGLYLWHVPVIEMLPAEPGLGQAVLALAVGVPIAFGSYALFERRRQAVPRGLEPAI